MSEATLRPLVEPAYRDRSLLEKPETKEAVLETLALLDQGNVRVATQDAPGKWTTHSWIKEAILLYFAIQKMAVWKAGPLEFYNKIPAKQGLESAGVRVVPPGPVRCGPYLEPVDGSSTRLTSSHP